LGGSIREHAHLAPQPREFLTLGRGECLRLAAVSGAHLAVVWALSDGLERPVTTDEFNVLDSVSPNPSASRFFDTIAP